MSYSPSLFYEAPEWEVRGMHPLRQSHVDDTERQETGLLRLLAPQLSLLQQQPPYAPHPAATCSGSMSRQDDQAAIQTAIDSISSGQRVVITASGSIGATTITIDSSKTFEGGGTIDVGNRNGRGAIVEIQGGTVNGERNLRVIGIFPSRRRSMIIL
ncbi:uncharacterized protein MYCFIDRAFT_175640 [Pseudocercospora fijiensis CIRAD86]|uniref:Uncharacterized protein n=1 Tax=Pseudocercospora fijiensis (strain CIRAD86) TaxID=383855 RepID=M3ABZ2_PSEFD|nr:uncharacterized protein MYCFIDRAFT_175640 [Pseudocercospora fijiensis CIRAD86]EME82086.1 hypothetical protein MYCFIDRAFT_175640 [Pseudocercospora fijiensis CIRAD86]